MAKKIKTIEQAQAETKYGDVFLTSDFLDRMERGSIISYDGWGSPHDGENELDDIDIFEFIYKTAPTMTKEDFCRKYPYVVWYNK